MATKLLVYNASLLLCGERKLASLTENREPRRLLDDVYDGGAIKTCLEAAYWNFGTRSTRVEYDPSVAPDFGFKRGFAKPSDWCRTAVVSADEYYRSRLTDNQFADEAGYWWSDQDFIYVKMVSDGTDYGGDLANWTETFARYFEAYLASRIAFKITRSKDRIIMIDKEVERLLKGATAKDAQDSGASVMPEGKWNNSRRGRRGRSFRDGGVRDQLIG